MPMLSNLGFTISDSYFIIIVFVMNEF